MFHRADRCAQACGTTYPLRPLLASALLAFLPLASAQVETMDPVTVSATRSPEPRSRVPLSVEVLPADAFLDPSSPTVDGALRSMADFSLFRRNDSMTANPTTQGVSLRGLGPSGTSRSLVLLDGVPLNDPFGGWVPWSLVPVESLAGAELVPGGGASAWGNAALGGVIQLFSAVPAAGSGNAVLRAADFGTESAGVSEALAAGAGTLELRGAAFSTAGAVLVAPEGRGPVDIAAASRHNLQSARWRGPLGPGAQLVVTVRRFEEWRDNGTPYQQNRLRQLFGSVAVSGGAGPSRAWSATAYVQDQGSSQAFSSVNAARTAETPASDQFDVPATAVGLAGSATLSDTSGGSTTLGADLRDVRGETREDYLYSKGAYTARRFAGGSQAFEGLYAERSQPLGPGLHAMAGVRLDRWENTDGHLRTSSIASGSLTQDSRFQDSSGTEFSPSAGITWDPSGELRLHAAAQRAFREPTLNELYRPFRQGTTTTLANAALKTEHADTAEAGATWTRGAVRFALTAFAARLEDPVANVTLAQGPGNFPLFGTLAAGAVGQERLNLGRVDTRGVEVSLQWRPLESLKVELSAIDESARVGSAPVAPSLFGRATPEVPRWSGSLGLTWHPAGRLYASVRVRSSALQYDDDQNQLPLAAYSAVDASLRFAVSPHAEVFAGVDNAGNARVETAHSAAGVYSLAPPRTAGAGVRLGW